MLASAGAGAVDAPVPIVGVAGADGAVVVGAMEVAPGAAFAPVEPVVPVVIDDAMGADVAEVAVGAACEGEFPPTARMVGTVGPTAGMAAVEGTGGDVAAGVTMASGWADMFPGTGARNGELEVPTVDVVAAATTAADQTRLVLPEADLLSFVAVLGLGTGAEGSPASFLASCFIASGAAGALGAAEAPVSIALSRF